jgi:membrane protein
MGAEHVEIDGRRHEVEPVVGIRHEPTVATRHRRGTSEHWRGTADGSPEVATVPACRSPGRRGPESGPRAWCSPTSGTSPRSRPAPWPRACGTGSFFALLSLPSFVLGLVASAGYLGRSLGTDLLGGLRVRIAELATTALAPDVVHGVILRTFDEVVRAGRPEVVSLGFLLSVWSGSRALNVYLDTITIMYGLGGRRGIVRTRLLSLRLYLVALAAAVVVLPLLLVGPGLLEGFVRDGLGGGDDSSAWAAVVYWLVLVLVAVAGLATLFHLAPPVRTAWRRCLPGAGVALVLWVLASVALRVVIGGDGPVEGHGSVYGPLAAPVALLVWLYLLALAVLVGAALNATVERRLRPEGGASLPRARRRLLDDAPQVRGRDAEGGRHVAESSPVRFATARHGEHEVGEPPQQALLAQHRELAGELQEHAEVAAFPMRREVGGQHLGGVARPERALQDADGDVQVAGAPVRARRRSLGASRLRAPAQTGEDVGRRRPGAPGQQLAEPRGRRNVQH